MAITSANIVRAYTNPHAAAQQTALRQLSGQSHPQQVLDIARVAMFNRFTDMAVANGLSGMPKSQIERMVNDSMGALMLMDNTSLQRMSAGGGSAMDTLASATFNTYVSSLSPQEKQAYANPQAAQNAAGAAGYDGSKGGFWDAKGNTKLAMLGSGGGSSHILRDYGALAEPTKYDSAKGVVSLSAENFSSSPFHGSGLGTSDIPMIKALANQGFSNSAIMQAGKDRQSFGLTDPKSIENLAHIRKYDPRIIKGLHKFDSDAKPDIKSYVAAKLDAEKADKEGRHEDAAKARKIMEKYEAEIQKKGRKLESGVADPKIRQRVHEQWKKQEEHQKKLEEDAQRRIRGMNLSPEEHAKAQKTLRDYRENPNSEAAKKEMAKLEAHAQKDPGSKKKLEAIKHDIKQMAKAEEKVLQKKTTVEAKKVSSDKRKDEALSREAKAKKDADAQLAALLEPQKPQKKIKTANLNK